ncbi:MAG: YicC family protein [Acidobacteria bacterium]|nr:YicC family protein [Acidobacteriota bacterium]
MTGFAAVRRETPQDAVQVTIKSVNHRFLDALIKAPSALASIEPTLKALVQQKLARGRVELSVAAETSTPVERELVLDERLVERAAAAFERARSRGVAVGPLTASDVLRIPHAVEVRVRADAAGGVSAALTALLEAAVIEAVDALVRMREQEGAYLAADLAARLETLQTFVSQIASDAKVAQQHLELKLRERLAALPPDLTGDSSATAREIVRFVARSDIDEELVRMGSHFDHWRALVGADEPCGRKLDFLVQEMNRELNTIGSKVEGASATQTVVAAKAELERVREQVQNVE